MLLTLPGLLACLIFNTTKGVIMTCKEPSPYQE
ncbi:hypothetical protein LINPERHAP1_LOCUS15911 [Linum perenne]